MNNPTDNKPRLVDGYSPAEIEFMQCLLDRYSEDGGIIPLMDDHPAFMAIVRRHYVALRSHERMREALEEQLAEAQMLAFKWMDAHDKLHAGKPYSFPKPADLPDALAEALQVVREAREAMQAVVTAYPVAAGTAGPIFGEEEHGYGTIKALRPRIDCLTAFLAQHEDKCPSCGGLNTSCLKGCSRDPSTGELNGTSKE